MSSIRRLVDADSSAYEEFILRHLDTSMFLLGNYRSAGFNWTGKRPSGIFLGCFDDQHRLLGVLALFYNGNLMPQSPLEHLLALLDAMRDQPEVLQHSVCFRGLVGDALQCQLLRKYITVGEVTLDCIEKLYRLQLKDLIVPPLLADEAFTVRLATVADQELLAEWMVLFDEEALNQDTTLEQQMERISASVEDGSQFVLESEGHLLATSSFNARVQEAWQVGGVFTPEQHRCKGYARAVVAGSLLYARKQGVTGAILFADLAAAQKAYAALGFQQLQCGFSLFLFEPPALSPLLWAKVMRYSSREMAFQVIPSVCQASFAAKNNTLRYLTARLGETPALSVEMKNALERWTEDLRASSEEATNASRDRLRALTLLGLRHPVSLLSDCCCGVTAALQRVMRGVAQWGCMTEDQFERVVLRVYFSEFRCVSSEEPPHLQRLSMRLSLGDVSIQILQQQAPDEGPRVQVHQHLLGSERCLLDCRGSWRLEAALADVSYALLRDADRVDDIVALLTLFTQ